MMDAFRNFCEDSLRQKKLAKEFKDRAANPNDTIKKCKLALENFMIENDLESAKISLEGFMTPMTYLTRSTKVQSRRINRETMEEGLEYSFSSEAIPADESPRSLGKRIWDNINQARKMDKMVMRISDKPESKRKMLAGGEDAPYQYDATREMGKTVRDYWTAQKVIKRLRDTRKERSKMLKTRIDTHCPKILSHMGARNKTSQRINMRHNNTPCSFYVRVKTSSTRPPIKKEGLCALIEAAIREAPSRQEIPALILQRFDDMPRKTQQKVTLDRGHYQPDAEAAAASVTESVFDEEDEEDGLDTFDE